MPVSGKKAKKISPLGEIVKYFKKIASQPLAARKKNQEK